MRTSSNSGRLLLWGDHSKPLSLQHWNGWTGSIDADFWSPSEISRQPKPSKTTTPPWTISPWQHNLNKQASGNPGAVQFQYRVSPEEFAGRLHLVCGPEFMSFGRPVEVREIASGLNLCAQGRTDCCLGRSCTLADASSRQARRGECVIMRLNQQVQ